MLSHMNSGSCKVPMFYGLFFSEGSTFETGTLQNVKPGFPGLRGERGTKGNQGQKGIKGNFCPLEFFVPQTTWRRLSGE